MTENSDLARHNTLQARMYAQLERWPERRAIGFYNAQGDSSWLTYEEFFGKAAGYGTRLAEYGLGRGDVCIIVLPSNQLSASLVLATLFLGAVPLLVAPPFLQGAAAHSSLKRVLDHVVRKARPRVVVCPESMAYMSHDLQKGRRRTCFLFGEGDLGPEFPIKAPSLPPVQSEIAAMQLTSGTTGFPRICVWKQKSVLAALDGMRSAMKLTEEDLCLNWTPLYHDMGLVNNYLLCLANGVPLVMLSPNDFVRKPALWLRALSETGTTLTWSPNFGFTITAQRVHDGEIQGVQLHNVRAFWNAAERIHYGSMSAFYERFKPYGVRLEALKTNFGCAENIGGATFSDPDGAFVVEHVNRAIFLEKRIAQPVAAATSEVSTLTVVGVGKPYPGINIQIVSSYGRPLPDGHIGEIALETPSRMEGYLGEARETSRALKDGLLRTGDMGYLRNGELFWVGRRLERLNIRGKKLDPSDFEPILFHVPGLRHGNFAAFGVDDTEEGTQRLVIVAEVKEQASVDSMQISSEIRNQVLSRLGLNVSEVVLVRPNTLTKTSSGKRRHRYCRQLFLEGRLKDFEVA
jgi:fatty-acyl-CoA synthase